MTTSNDALQVAEYCRAFSSYPKQVNENARKTKAYRCVFGTDADKDISDHAKALSFHETNDVFSQLNATAEMINSAKKTRTKWTLEVLVDKYEDTYDAAMAASQYGPANKSLEAIGKIHGFDDQIIKVKVDVKTISADVDPNVAAKAYADMMKAGK